MEIKAFIQMGTERRETIIAIPDEEFQGGVSWVEGSPKRSLECWLEEYVTEWLQHQYGWGWSGAGFDNDFTFMEGSDGAGLAVVAESGIPNTIKVAGRTTARSNTVQIHPLT